MKKKMKQNIIFIQNRQKKDNNKKDTTQKFEDKNTNNTNNQINNEIKNIKDNTNQNIEKNEEIEMNIKKDELELEYNNNEEEDEIEYNFYSKYDEYYSEQPLLLKESNPKTKFNEIDLNNFYPKLKHIKAK